MAELNFKTSVYDGPALDGYRSEVDEEDLEHILIASREHIYSQPIQTLVQEYINNGKDANRAAGKPDNAMDITVPTYDNMGFICRDYGTGLSKDEIIQVYRKIGKSTKRTNNTLAGKYGVGAKIGFVYTDAFLITSWKDGRKIECLAHKANSQIGDYTFLSDVETNEPNGVQISIKLTDASHISQFKDAIKRIFFLWPEKPKFNIEISWPSLEYEDQCIKILSEYDHNSFSEQFINRRSLWLNVDGTPYKIPDTILNRCGINISFYHKAVYINATLTDVDIPMNREELTTNSKLESFLRSCPEKIELARNEVLNRIANKDDFVNILEIKKHILNYMPFFRVGKVEVYAKAINRKFTYDGGWFYMEPKEEDLFQHFLAHEGMNNCYERAKFSTNNIFCEKTSTLVINKIKKHPHNKKDHSIWTIPDGKMFPEDIWKFCNLRDYYDMFPKKIKEKTAKDKVASDIVYYNLRLQRIPCTREEFLKKHDITKPIFYSLFENKFEKSSVLYKLYDLYYFDLKDRGSLIGIIPRNLKKLQTWNYTLICIDTDYVFSKKVYVEFKRSLYNDILGYRCNIGYISSKLDPDINYIKACISERKKGGGNNLCCENESLPENIKKFIKKEREKVKTARNRIYKRYPFMDSLSYDELRRIEPWMSTYLIPLLLSNPQLEQNKLEKLTTDSI